MTHYRTAIVDGYNLLPRGRRLRGASERVTAIISQTGSAYEEGLHL